MLRRDVRFYQTLLHELSLGELVTLYEQTMPEYAVLAQIIAEELDQRLGA